MTRTLGFPASANKTMDSTLLENTDASHLLRLIAERRSFRPKFLGPPYPDRRRIETFVAAALTAPDHGVLRPWRFLKIEERGRTRLEDAFAAAAREADPNASEETLREARKKALDCPCLLAAVAVLDPRHPFIPESEQLIAVGAALHNFLLAAHAHGFAGTILSGKRVLARALREALELEDYESLVGFISLGTPIAPPKPRPPSRVADHLQDWPA
jgi:nitroreductase